MARTTLANDGPDRNDASRSIEEPIGDGAIHVVGAAIVRGGRVLAARRAPHVAHPGAWEFPGGKVELGEQPKEALRREIAEELELAIDVHEPLGRGVVALEDGRTVALDVYRATLREDSPPRLSDHDAVRWLGPDALTDVAWAAADVPVLGAVRALLRALAGSVPNDETERRAAKEPE